LNQQRPGPPPRRQPNLAMASSTAGLDPALQDPVIPVLLLALSTIATWSLWFTSKSDGAGQTVDIYTSSVVGWALGGVVGAVLFSWFRSVDLARRSSLTYVEKSWRPALLAGALAFAGWAGSFAHAWAIASSVARR
jgi:hypothetical protein